MKTPKYLQPLVDDLKKWSPWHYLFDGLLTLLFTTLYKQAADVSVLQAVWVGVLTFGVIGSGMMLYRSQRRPMTFKDFVEVERARDMVRETHAVSHAMTMFHTLIECCPDDTDDPDWQKRYKLWRSMARSFICGTLRDGIAAEFDKRAQNVSDPSSVKLYLVGLVNNLTRKDLRSHTDPLTLLDVQEAAAS